MKINLFNFYRLLANALRANETLKILRCDQNNITIDGYAAILSALRHNSTLTMVRKKNNLNFNSNFVKISFNLIV